MKIDKKKKRHSKPSINGSSFDKSQANAEIFNYIIESNSWYNINEEGNIINIIEVSPGQGGCHPASANTPKTKNDTFILLKNIELTDITSSYIITNNIITNNKIKKINPIIINKDKNKVDNIIN
tara:strand:+ start:2727 stop:3098 length:372 start_codon:yes stop_codon:yes gene_type:complete